MDLALQLLFTGIGIGAVYALVALGFVLIFRATNVVNFAQGEFSMVAAYLMVVFAVDLGWPYWLSFLLALAGMALLGAIFNLGVYYPLRHRTFLPVIIATIGASILMANSVLAIYGPQPQVLEGWFETPGIQLGPVYLDSQYLLIIAVTVVLVIFNYWFFEHTMLGKKLQATSQDKEMASLLGISVSTMIMITFIYSAVLGGLAGILVAPVLFVSIQMGSTIALKAFAATIIGGFGDVAGAIIGGSRSASSKPSARPIFRCPTRTALPSWCWCCSWCSGRRASSANASRRKHERAQREHADRGGRAARKAAAAASSAVFHRRRDRWWRSPRRCGSTAISSTS